MRAIKTTQEYLLRILPLWIVWFWFIALDAIVLVIDTFIPSFSPPWWLYWVIPAIGFVVANIKLFGELESEKAGLQKQIDEFEDTSARILLEVTETEFSHSYGNRRSPFRGIQSNPRGFDQQGIPDWLVLWARLRISNIGYDSGTLIVKIDETNTKLPVFFDQQSFHLEFYAPSNLAGRTERTEDLNYDVLFAGN